MQLRRSLRNAADLRPAVGCIWQIPFIAYGGHFASELLPPLRRHKYALSARRRRAIAGRKFLAFPGLEFFYDRPRPAAPGSEFSGSTNVGKGHVFDLGALDKY